MSVTLLINSTLFTLQQGAMLWHHNAKASNDSTRIMAAHGALHTVDQWEGRTAMTDRDGAGGEGSGLRRWWDRWGGWRRAVRRVMRLHFLSSCSRPSCCSTLSRGAPTGEWSLCTTPTASAWASRVSTCLSAHLSVCLLTCLSTQLTVSVPVSLFSAVYSSLSLQSGGGWGQRPGKILCWSVSTLSSSSPVLNILLSNCDITSCSCQGGASPGRVPSKCGPQGPVPPGGERRRPGGRTGDLGRAERRTGGGRRRRRRRGWRGGGEEEEETRRRRRGGEEDRRTAEGAVCSSVSSAGAHTHTPAAAYLHRWDSTSQEGGNAMREAVHSGTCSWCCCYELNFNTFSVCLCVCVAVRTVSQWVVCVVVAVLCVAVLMLPLHTESSSVVPRCLHVSTNQKLVCAYTLGNTHTLTHTQCTKTTQGKERRREGLTCLSVSQVFSPWCFYGNRWHHSASPSVWLTAARRRWPLTSTHRLCPWM